jgi:hypothetical protein
VVSATDSCGRNLGFSRPEPLLFLPSSCSVVTRLSVPRSTHYFSGNLLSTSLLAGFLLDMLFYPEDGGSMLLNEVELQRITRRYVQYLLQLKFETNILNVD